jgi:hypothetical protein
MFGSPESKENHIIQRRDPNTGDPTDHPSTEPDPTVILEDTTTKFLQYPSEAEGIAAQNSTMGRYGFLAVASAFVSSIGAMRVINEVAAALEGQTVNTDTILATAGLLAVGLLATHFGVRRAYKAYQYRLEIDPSTALTAEWFLGIKPTP